MTEEPVPYYSKEMLELLRKVFYDISPETSHKLMNPLCGVCLAERGRRIIEGKGEKDERIPASKQAIIRGTL